MFIPVLVFLIIIHYWPLLGIRYSFYDYYPGRQAPTFVGMKHFQYMFATAAFWTAFKNTLELSIIKLIITTVSSVVVSIFLNEMGNLLAKKSLQTIIYLPHFMSWQARAFTSLQARSGGVRYSISSISGRKQDGERLFSLLPCQALTLSCMKRLISTELHVSRKYAL